MTDFPLSHFDKADVWGFDTETRDPNLLTLGPGNIRKDGYVCGFTIATRDVSLYLDLRHPDTLPETRERHTTILRWLCQQHKPVVGANLLYDLEWLATEGFTPKWELHDVQYAEPLLSEYDASYNLHALSVKYGLEEKATALLEDYCKAQRWTGAPQSHIYKMPVSAVRKYAELDGTLPVQILDKQTPSLKSQGLWDLYRLECALMPVLLQMRKTGVRIDIARYKEVCRAAVGKVKELSQELYSWAGGTFNLNSSAQLARILKKKGIEVPRKESGTPTVDAEVLGALEAQNVVAARKILQYRHFDSLFTKFLIPYAKYMHNGRIHCQFHPLRTDDYGAVSGRFSCSKPNLQQVSALKEDKWSDGNPVLQGRVVRSLFIPEDGCLWAKCDYSQLEYRVLAHYALGDGSDALRAAYNENPRVDYHQYIVDMTGFERRTAKRLNFGLGYGMGEATAARKFGWTLDESKHFIETFHEHAPYVRETRRRVLNKAKRAGYIKTFLQRRARVHPSRATHSIYNRLIQGTAGDIFKQALVSSYNAGIFNVLPLHLIVHDEADTSMPDKPEGREALKELTHVMETCVQLRVPLVVDPHVAPTWAEAD